MNQIAALLYAMFLLASSNLGWACEAEALAIPPLLPVDQPARILLVGNSHIFMNNLPSMLQRLAESGGMECVCGDSSWGGYDLERHAANEETLSLIGEGAWDIVILQERTSLPLSEWAISTQPAVVALDVVISSVDARTLLLMMWVPYSTTGEDGSQQESARTVIETAARIDAPVAPIGLAWEALQDAYPEIGLWRSDRIHATEAGTYLMACVIFSTLWGHSPLGLAYTAGLEQSDARAIQQIATQVVSEFANPSS